MSSSTLLNTQCSVCGASIVFPANVDTVTCEYCLRPNARPKSRATETGEMKYANERRNMGEFDVAAACYRRVLEKSIDEHEARWGLLLCKYGVIYVEDPATHQRVITCRKAMPSAIRAEADYRICLRQATGEVRDGYERDAACIDRIQAEIRRIRAESRPWDAFLCFKETDGYGGKTLDSGFARMLYHRLTARGYNIFYPPESLKGLEGEKYEAAIFTAIADARVMLVIGMKREYFDSAWVRNKWMRYLSLVDAGEDKQLVPMFQSLDPAEDLPMEFRVRFIHALNIQDPGCMFYVEDLLRRAMQRGVSAKQGLEGKPAVAIVDRRALENALFLVEDGRFDEAEGPLNEIIQQAPDCAEAYMGLCRVRARAQFIEDLPLAKLPLKKEPSFRRALRYANDAQKEEWQAIADRQAERLAREAEEKKAREAEEAKRLKEERARREEQERKRREEEEKAQRLAEEEARQALARERIEQAMRREAEERRAAEEALRLSREARRTAAGCEIRDSWEQIMLAIGSGEARELYAVGAWKPLQMKRMGTIRMRLAGFEVDDRAEGSGCAATTWIAMDLLPGNQPINPKLSYVQKVFREGTGSVGGWEKCALRRFLNSQLRSELPKEVANRLVPVRKEQLSFNAVNQRVKQETVDALWIPSQREVFGRPGQPAAYSQLFADPRNRMLARPGQGMTAWWWLRTVSSANTGFGRVGANGASSSGLSYLPGGVLFGFCL